MRMPLVLAGTLGVLLLWPGSAGAAEESYLWESFEGPTTWAVESARGPVEAGRADTNATDGQTSLKLRYVPAGRNDFEVRRECQIDLSKMDRVVVDVTVDQIDVRMAVAFRATSGELYYETPAVLMKWGLNRNVTFQLDTRDFNGFENPAGKAFQKREDVRRVSLVFWRSTAKKGEVYVDNVRFVGAPEIKWETFAPRRINVHQSQPIVPARKTVELRVDFQASFADAFNPNDVRLWATVHEPDGKVVVVPGFLARFEEPAGAAPATAGAAPLKPPTPVWLVRFTPRAAGKYEYAVTVKNAMGETVSEPKSFTAVENAGADGFVVISPSDRWSFETDSGKPFYPIGQNVCWSADYERFFAKMQAAGENTVRVWICPWNTMLEKKGELGKIDLDEAAKVDAMLNLAQKHGLRVMLCLQYHGMLNPSSWAENPYNAKNGGPCSFASDYFVNADARAYTKRFLRYVAARWGSHPALFAWELFNEVDLAEYYNADDVLAWHREMAAYLRSVDGHARPIASSAWTDAFAEKLWKLSELDFNMVHVYAADAAELICRKAVEARVYDKPFFVGEFGGGAKPEDDQKDPKGARLHAALWSSFASPAAGAVLPWWWDTHVEPNDLYVHFAGLSAFASGEDRRGRRFEVARAMIDAPGSAPAQQGSAVASPGNRRVAVQAVLDHSGGYLWVCDVAWLANPLGPDGEPIGAGVVVNLTGLLDGPYAVEIWDTLKTGRRSTQTLNASQGKLAVTLPAFKPDLAMKVKFLGTRTPGIQSTAGQVGEQKSADEGR